MKTHPTTTSWIRLPAISAHAPFAGQGWLRSAKKRTDQFLKKAMCLTAVAAVQLGASVARADDKAEGYLEDGKLKERIEILELQGGIAGFNGTYYRIEPDGNWSTGQVIQHTQKEPKANGKLTREQLAQLAKVMADHDLANLPSFGEPVANPQLMEIRFGKKAPTLTSRIMLDENSLKPEEKLIHNRYNGIVKAVKQLCVEPKKE